MRLKDKKRDRSEREIVRIQAWERERKIEREIDRETETERRECV